MASSWEGKLRKNQECLDKIDFIPYFEKYDELKYLIAAVEGEYNYTYFTENDFLNGYLFEYMDAYDILQYLNQRYSGQYILREDEDYEPPVYIRKVTK